MNDLIKKLEALDTPCIEFFAEAFLAIHGPQPQSFSSNSQETSDWFALHIAFFKKMVAGAWLDAAEMLLPKGSDWLRKGFFEMSVVIEDQNEKKWARHIDGHHKRPSIALCIAALRTHDANPS